MLFVATEFDYPSNPITNNKLKWLEKHLTSCTTIRKVQKP
jgi:hypothetical protein